MIRGTTPTEIYTITGADDLDLSRCVQIWVNITDKRGLDYTWDISRLVIDPDDSKIYLTLTQEETLMFTVGDARLQIRFLYDDGAAFATKPLVFPIEDVKRGGVIYERV